MIASASAPDGSVTRAQEALWFAEQLDDLGAANSLPLSIAFGRRVDPTALSDALAALVAAQPALATRFAERRGRLRRLERPAPRPELERLRCRDEQLPALVEQVSREPLELLRQPWRALLISTPSADTLLVDAHHAIFDGPSKDLFAEQLLAALRALEAGREPALATASLTWMDEPGRTEEIERLAPLARTHWEPAFPLLVAAASGRDESPPGHARALRRWLDGALVAQLRGGRTQPRLQSLRAVHRCAASAAAGARRADGGGDPVWGPGRRRLSARSGCSSMTSRCASRRPACAPSTSCSPRRRSSCTRSRSCALFRTRRQSRGSGRAPTRGGWRCRSTSATAASMEARRPARPLVDRLLPIYGRPPHRRLRLLRLAQGCDVVLEYDDGSLVPTAAVALADRYEALLRGPALTPEVELRDATV